MNAKDYLRLPYRRVLVPDPESGRYTALIAEFPGCLAEGETPDTAYAKLERVAESWIDTALEMKQAIPAPTAEAEASGRFALRLPRSLHQRASDMAEQDGVSLNTFFVAAVAERVGVAGSCHELVARGEAILERFAAATIRERIDLRTAVTPGVVGRQGSGILTSGTRLN